MLRLHTEVALSFAPIAGNCSWQDIMVLFNHWCCRWKAIPSQTFLQEQTLSKNLYRLRTQPSILLLSLQRETTQLHWMEILLYSYRNKDNNATNQCTLRPFRCCGLFLSCNSHVLRTKREREIQWNSIPYLKEKQNKNQWDSSLGTITSRRRRWLGSVRQWYTSGWNAGLPVFILGEITSSPAGRSHF